MIQVSAHPHSYSFLPLNISMLPYLALSVMPYNNRQFTSSLWHLLSRRANRDYKGEVVYEINRTINSDQLQIERDLRLSERFGHGTRLRGTILV
jgi:hypothetical protein